MVADTVSPLAYTTGVYRGLASLLDCDQFWCYGETFWVGTVR